MRLRCLVILLWLSVPGWAQSWQAVRLPTRTPVYNKPNGHDVELYLPSGARVQTWPVSSMGFQLVRFRYNGHWLRGYVHFPLETDRRAGREGLWAVGLGWTYAQFIRKANSFTDTDQVTYSTSQLNSHSGFPELVVQTSDHDFWRLILSYKPLHYVGTATTNASLSTEALDIKENFLSFNIQTAWSLWSYFFLGLGAEVGKALTTSVVKGGVRLDLSQSQYPVYAGPQVFAGVDWPISSHFSTDIEARYEVIASQSPMVTDYELSIFALYWL